MVAMMPFGSHHRRPILLLPTEYLRWLAIGKNAALAEKATAELRRRKNIGASSTGSLAPIQKSNQRQPKDSP